MALVDRVRNILVTPKTEWPRIAEEAATPQSLYLGYIAILAAIGPLAMLVHDPMRMAAAAILSYLISLAVTFLLALIVDGLAPTFGGEKNFVQSLKLTAYSYTAAWLAGIFQLIGMLGGILGLLAAIYSFYTFFLGVPTLKKCPPDKAAVYTIVVVICGLLLGIALTGVLMSTFVGGGMMGGMGLGAMR